MNIDKQILDDLTAQAKTSPRLRMNFDLRNSAEDDSQRMLNALEPGTVIYLRGHFEELFYDEEGNLTETVDMLPGGVVVKIEKNRWHSLRCLESATVLFEAKDGPYEPIGPEDILQ